MAGKSRKVASRQGELSRRRKRAQRGPIGVPATTDHRQSQQNGGTASVTAEASEGATTATQAPATTEQAAAPAATRPAQQVATQARGPRARGERPAAYNYVGAELRRIGVLSTFVVAALIVIAVVL